MIGYCVISSKAQYVAETWRNVGSFSCFPVHLREIIQECKGVLPLRGCYSCVSVVPFFQAWLWPHSRKKADHRSPHMIWPAFISSPIMKKSLAAVYQGPFLMPGTRQYPDIRHLYPESQGQHLGNPLSSDAEFIFTWLILHLGVPGYVALSWVLKKAVITAPGLLCAVLLVWKCFYLPCFNCLVLFP